MARADALARLALAYGIHQARRRLTRRRSQLADLVETYAADGIRAVEPEMRERHPHLVNCINCGLCALAAGRLGKTRLPDLASSYMRLYARLSEASSDLAGNGGGAPGPAPAASVCPGGAPPRRRGAGGGGGGARRGGGGKPPARNPRPVLLFA